MAETPEIVRIMGNKFVDAYELQLQNNDPDFDYVFGVESPSGLIEVVGLETGSPHKDESHSFIASGLGLDNSGSSHNLEAEYGRRHYVLSIKWIISSCIMAPDLPSISSLNSPEELGLGNISYITDDGEVVETQTGLLSETEVAKLSATLTACRPVGIPRSIAESIRQSTI